MNITVYLLVGNNFDYSKLNFIQLQTPRRTTVRNFLINLRPRIDERITYLRDHHFIDNDINIDQIFLYYETIDGHTLFWNSPSSWLHNVLVRSTIGSDILFISPQRNHRLYLKQNLQLNLDQGTSFLGLLPIEIHFHIFKFLNNADLLNFICASRIVYQNWTNFYEKGVEIKNVYSFFVNIIEAGV